MSVEQVHTNSIVVLLNITYLSPKKYNVHCISNLYLEAKPLSCDGKNCITNVSLEMLCDLNSSTVTVPNLIASTTYNLYLTWISPLPNISHCQLLGTIKTTLSGI